MCNINQLRLGISGAMLFATITVLTYVQLFFHISLSYPISIFGGFILTSVYLFFFSAKKSHLLCLVGMLGFAFMINVLLPDFSSDGQSYHMKAIQHIAYGWNPFAIPEINTDYIHALWINHYPKALWMWSAAWFAASGNIFIGKAYHLLLIFINFLLVNGILSHYEIKKKIRFLLDFVIVISPVTAVECFVYYNDATIYEIMLCLSLLVYIRMNIELSWKECFIIDLLFVCLTAILMNLKFTTVVYAIIFLCAIFGILAYKRFQIKRYIFIFISALILGVGFMGYNPYITNFMYHGHPFWPVMGNNTVDVLAVSDISKETFVKQNMVVKLLKASFSCSANENDITIRYKIPGAVSFAEVRAMAVPDARIGGFGPWFGLVLLCSMVVFGYMIKRRKITFLYGWILFCILFSTLINPVCWWARYVPQFYGFFVFLLTIAMIELPKEDNKKYLVWFFLGVLCVNELIVLTGNVAGEFMQTVKMQRGLATVKNTGDVQVWFDQDFFVTPRIYLDRKNIDYKEVYNELDKQPVDVFIGVAKEHLKIYPADRE